MSRSGVPSGFSDDSLVGFVAVELFFDSGTVRLWNGYGDLSFNSETFVGSASLISVSEIEESAEIGAKGISLSLNGVNATLLSLALAEPYQNRIVKVYVGTIESGTASGYNVFAGRMDVMTIQETGQSSKITLTAENRLIDLERPRVRRYTHRDQIKRFTGDKGLIYINSLQSKTFKWGG